MSDNVVCMYAKTEAHRLRVARWTPAVHGVCLSCWIKRGGSRETWVGITNYRQSR